jgi:diaminohydroxyphosphoribosylaminopyrimidine deaminase/5-amino-6-(5-phosphoribosylamino)uracil reductase
MKNTKDIKFMKKALSLASKREGLTSPNPLVGAVIVRGNKIISTGYHKKAGSPHAEIVALKSAGQRAKGSTLYINLEPCTHYGRTPPCVPEIIKAGIKRVVMAMKDPNPLVNGKGLEELKAEG